MEHLYDFLNWAWQRHHNPLSWYIRPLFVLPFCYFAYKKSVTGLLVTIVAVTSSMFWFPAPSEVDPRAGEVAWSIVPAVAVGFVVCNGVLLFAHRRLAIKRLKVAR